MTDWLSSPFLALLVAAFFCGGVVKGLMGIAMPLVVVPVLAHIVPVKDAVALMVMPILISNAIQMTDAGFLRSNVRVLWPLLVTLAGGIIVGVSALGSLDERVLILIMGLATMAFVTVVALTGNIAIGNRHEVWLAPLVGLVAGIIGGLTSFFGPPIIAYLSSIQKNPDRFVSMMGLVYFVGAVPFTISLFVWGYLEHYIWLASMLMTLPLLGGMVIGRWIRRFVSEARFKNLLLGGLFLIGLNLLHKAAFY